MQRILLFFGVGFVLLLGLNGLSQLSDGPGQLAAMRSGLDRLQGREAVSLGGSIGRAISFPDMCLNGEPYYWNNQDLFEVAALADLILDRPSPPRYWFVVAAPTSEFYDNGAQGSQFAAVRREVHQLMFRHGRFGMIGGDWRQQLVAALTPALGYRDWMARRNAAFRTLGIGAAPPPVRKTVVLDPALAEPQAADLARQWRERLERIAYYDSTTPARSTRVLLRMNRRIRAAGGVMILVVPPMTGPMRTASARRLGPQVRAFDRLLERLEADGVVVSRRWADPAFARRYDLYSDSMHLNRTGAARFSRSLAAELRLRRALPMVSCFSSSSRAPDVGIWATRPGDDGRPRKP